MKKIEAIIRPAKVGEVCAALNKIGHPGIMITDFTMGSLARMDGERRKRTTAVFNILGDRPETVAAFLVPRMLAARVNGVRIAWLGGAKIAWRFMTAPIAKRRVIEG